MHRFGNRLQETATTSGTADFSLGGAVAGYRPFSAVTGIQAGDTLSYLAIQGTDWEVGTGTYSPGVLARTQVLASSTGSKVSFTTPPFVLNTLTAEEMASLGQAPVTSVNGQTGDVVLDAGDVGADPSGSAASAQSAAIAASQPRDTDLTALGNLTGTGMPRRISDGNWVLDTPVVVPVTSVNGQTGDVVLDNFDVGADPNGAAASAEASAKAASQPRDADLTAIAALTGAGQLNRVSDGNWNLTAPASAGTGVLRFELDGAGVALTVGQKKALVRAPFNGTITRWTIIADTGGSVTLEVWKSSYSGWSAASTITGGDKPVISSANKNTGSSLTAWSTTFVAGDIFQVSVDSIVNITHLLLELDYNRT